MFALELGSAALLCTAAPSLIWVFSNFYAQAEDSVNANAGAFELAPGDLTELDCGALLYCSAGGTGHEYSAPSNGVQPSGNPDHYNEGPAFPVTPRLREWPSASSDA